jgi:hypothetical protein
LELKKETKIISQLKRQVYYPFPILKGSGVPLIKSSRSPFHHLVKEAEEIYQVENIGDREG